jgi:thioesterase domain-containing protein
LEEIRRRKAQDQYFLGDSSLGGSVALEMAQQLHAAGEWVALLAILDHTPPPLRYRRFTWTPRLIVDFPVNAARWCADELWHLVKGRRVTNALHGSTCRQAHRRCRETAPLRFWYRRCGGPAPIARVA